MNPAAEHDYSLENGLSLRIYDVSRHYFGGYWQVSVEARATVPVTEDAFDSAASFAEAKKLLGDSVEFSRRIEKMAVHSEEIASVREGLIERIRQHIIPLVSSERFPSGFIAAEYIKRASRKTRGIPCLL